MVGRGLVSSSAALDTSGSTPDVARGDATNSGGELIADDVTRRDVTIDDVIKDEVKPWWKFASTACDSWRPPQHVYFQVRKNRLLDVPERYSSFFTIILTCIKIFSILGNFSSFGASELRPRKGFSRVLVVEIYDDFKFRSPIGMGAAR